MVLRGEVCPCCGRQLPETAEAKIARLTAPVRASWQPEACWLWPARVDASGYGYVDVYVGKRTVRVRAHRHEYAHAHGPIPEGLGLMHLCDDRYAPGDITYRRCVNPAHLRPEPQAANGRRMAVLGRGRRKGVGAYRGKAVHNAMLDDAKVTEMRQRARAGATSTEIGAAFGIGQDTVAAALYGRTWAHVPGALPHPGRGYRRAGAPHLTREQALALRAEHAAGGVTIKALAVRESLPYHMVRNAVRGTTFRD